MRESQKAPEKKYLGDGVYASFDGFQVWLYTDGYVGNEHVQQSIAIEPAVFQELLQFVGPIWFDKAEDEKVN